ncbi:MAG: GNVR domain-containing protein, partial [Bacillota bacterium]|nr:GNVR domain-containing protein [Bacillota bacterium]
KWLITALTIIAVITSGILSYFILPPVYETKAVLMATQAADNQRRLTDDTNLEGIVDTLSRLPEMTMNTYVGQLENETLLKTVIKKLELEEEGYTVRGLSNMISASNVKDTNLIEVKVTNTDPSLAALIGNTLSEEFLKFISQKNKERMTQSIDMLQEQIGAVEKDLLEANKQLMEFNSKPRSINFVQEELKATLADLTLYQSLLLQTNIELDQLRAGMGEMEKSLANTSPVLLTETKEEQGIDPVTNEQIIVTKVTEEPNLNYNNLLAQIGAQRQRLAEQQAKANSISNVVVDLETKAKELQVELTEKNSEYNKIMRDVDRLERNHNLFTERLAQTQIFQSIDIGETSILVVQPAMEPTSPIKPNKKLNLTIAFVLALMVGVFLAFVLEFFDNNIKNADDVRKHLDLPVMGSIPRMNSNNMRN